MKTRKFSIAIIALAIVAFVACKKEEASVSNGPEKDKKEAFVCPQIDDMNAYLKEFRKKLKDVKSDEAMGIDEAAWHLACLANCDFCRVNVEYNDVQFDTVEMQVNVTDGVVLLSDLNTSYEQMCSKIQQFKKGFNLYNQSLYFINVFIDHNGNAKVALTSSFTTSSKDNEDQHLWYFEDSYVFDTACDYFFDSHTLYLWNGLGKTELQRILNLYEHYEFGSEETIIYYTPTQSHTFSYPNYPDSYGNSFTGNSRVFAEDVSWGANIYLSKEEMCYCLDSYLGLGYDYMEDNPLYENEHPAVWSITDTIIQFSYHRFPTHMHYLTVQYGRPYSVDPFPGTDPGPDLD